MEDNFFLIQGGFGGYSTPKKYKIKEKYLKKILRWCWRSPTHEIKKLKN